MIEDKDITSNSRRSIDRDIILEITIDIVFRAYIQRDLRY